MKVRAISEKEFFAKDDNNSVLESTPVKTDNKNAELERKMYWDSVFSIQNCAKFEEDIKSVGTEFTYFSLDGNNLKMINDTFGHEIGDEFLRIVANNVQIVWGSSNFYKRDEDKFIVLIKNKALSKETCISQIENFKALINKENSKYDFPVAVSVGFATSRDGSSLKEVIEIADECMYNDKDTFKKLHPEFNTRRERITSDMLRKAISNGDFSKAYKELRSIKEVEKEAPAEIDDDLAFDGVADNTAPKEIWDEKVPPKEVDEDLSNIEIDKAPDKDVWNEEKKHTQLVPVIQEDLSTVDVHDAEEAYQSNEFSRKVQPVLKETTEKAVASAVKYQNDKLKLEVAEVLSDEVGYRLSRYEKRRRRRDFREKVSGVAKFLVTVIVILFILGNQQLRLRFAIVFQDLGDLVVGLIKGEEVSSNKLVHDIFMGMGDELNELNTIRVNDGFTIDEEVETEESEVDIDDESREEKSNN